MADPFFVSIPFSPACSHPLSTSRHLEIPSSTTVDATFCTRLDFSDFFFSPWISPFILQPLLTALLPRFRSIFDLSRLDPSLFIRLLTLANLQGSYLCESSSRACDRFDDCFFFNRINCTCSCGATDHSVSKRYSDGGYFLTLCLSAFGT